MVAAVCIFVSRSVAKWLRARGAKPHVVRSARLSFLGVAIVFAILVLYYVFGAPPEISGLTLSAVILLIVTLALQTTISNVIAGAILFRNGVLRLQDTVQIGAVSGRVVQLGLVTTWLRLEDGSIASISNSTLLNGPLLNRSAAHRLEGEY